MDGAGGEVSGKGRHMPEQPSEPAARVVSDENRDAARWEALGTAFRSFHRAPCLGQSLGMGGAGGAGLFALRYVTARDMRSAGTWGLVTGGLLCASNWFVCRRAMYRTINAESSMLQKLVDAANQSDPTAKEEAILALQKSQREVQNRRE